MTRFEDIIKLKPKKFTEECALISVYFNMNRIKDKWFLNYISAPGGAWQELKIIREAIEEKFYIGKDEKRVDLIMQKEDIIASFYIAEAKELFRQILQEREKIDASLTDIFARVKKLYGEKVLPIYSYIVGVDTTNLSKNIADEVVKAEYECIKKTINMLPELGNGRVCVLAYWEGNFTKFLLVFSDNFSKELSEKFKKIFL